MNWIEIITMFTPILSAIGVVVFQMGKLSNVEEGVKGLGGRMDKFDERKIEAILERMSRSQDSDKKH